MNCSPELIEAHFDGELDASQRAAIELHMESCPGCSAAYARLKEQRAGIKAAAPYYNAPSGLRESVREALRHEAASETPAPSSRASWRWIAIAACLLLAVSLSWNIVQWRPRGGESFLAESILADHIRSLLGTHLVDVASSDQHTVKPWFAGKLDFSPAVKDLESQGFPLIGGRMEYLASRRAAALVYRRRQHVINLFIWPGQPSSGREVRLSRNGYNMLHWTDGPMTYWAVSDVSAGELDRLKDLYTH